MRVILCGGACAHSGYRGSWRELEFRMGRGADASAARTGRSGRTMAVEGIMENDGIGRRRYQGVGELEALQVE